MPEVQKRNSRHMVKEKRQISPLRSLYQTGQSPWYDNIERRLFKAGEFARLIDEYGILGVTSNPTIFEKAISGSADYDEQIRSLVKEGKDVYQIYDELAMQDVGTAADMLLNIFKKTNGIDGYVSIEVLPDYAYDAQKTVDCAKGLFKRLNRKNILIKVPGTKEGCAAIRALISEGINVNATLLFSVRQYEAAAKAYIDGLKDRLRENKGLKEVSSVASVFVSRIDTKIDKILEDLADKEIDPARKEMLLGLRGRAAVANSKIIYQQFKNLFGDKEFGGLGKNGANVQRVLWASTSTKNPNYRDVKYVEELIGQDSINTMPHQTALAFYDHGIVKSAVETDVDGAKKVLNELRSLGIDIDDVCRGLEESGVKAFCGSFNSLMGSIEKKAAGKFPGGAR